MYRVLLFLLMTCGLGLAACESDSMRAMGDATDGLSVDSDTDAAGGSDNDTVGGSDTDVVGGSDTDTSAEPSTKLFVTLVSHNEDTMTGNNASCLAFFQGGDSRWEANRAAVIEVANLVESLEAAWDFQTDVEYLNLILQKEGATDNFLRDLAERPSGRIALTAHAHESFAKNYADVANLVERVTGERNGLVGGFTAVACRPDGAQPEWEKFLSPLTPASGLGDDLVATGLTNGASAGHTCDPEASGVWRPSSHDDFFTDDPTSPLPTIGTGPGGPTLEETLEAIEALVGDMRAGRLEEGLMYTASVTVPQCDFDLAGSGKTPADIEAFINGVNSLKNGSGDIEWATYPQVLDIWESEYGSAPSLWRGQ